MMNLIIHEAYFNLQMRLIMQHGHATTWRLRIVIGTVIWVKKLSHSLTNLVNNDTSASSSCSFKFKNFL